MRITWIVLLCMSCTLPGLAQNHSGAQKVVIAGKEEEIKQYYFVMLVKGEAHDKISDKSMLNQLMQAHQAYIKKLENSGKLLLTGAFDGQGYDKEVFVFDCASEQEVMKLLKTDPAVMAGRFAYEIHPWWTTKNCLFK